MIISEKQYSCKKHGSIGSSFIKVGIDVPYIEKIFCFVCYIEMLEKHCELAMEIEDAEI